MAKKKKRKHQALQHNQRPIFGASAWRGNEGFHFLLPGSPPTPEMLEAMTKRYQERLRNSPLWDVMVKQFGEEKAEELLKECRAELR